MGGVEGWREDRALISFAARNPEEDFSYGERGVA